MQAVSRQVQGASRDWGDEQNKALYEDLSSLTVATTFRQSQSSVKQFSTTLA